MVRFAKQNYHTLLSFIESARDGERSHHEQHLQQHVQRAEMHQASGRVVVRHEQLLGHALVVDRQEQMRLEEGRIAIGLQIPGLGGSCVLVLPATSPGGSFVSGS